MVGPCLGFALIAAISNFSSSDISGSFDFLLKVPPFGFCPPFCA